VTDRTFFICTLPKPD